MNVDDDYYAEEGFRNYVPSTTDPGPWMLFGVCIYSLCCILCLPICVLFSKKRRKRRQNRLDGRNVDLNIDKADSKSSSPVLEEEKENNDYIDENMNCVIDLNGKAILENEMIDLDYEGNTRDIKTHSASTIQVRDLDNSTIEYYSLATFFSLMSRNGIMSKSNISLASGVISAGLASVASSATHKSMLSFHSRSRRRRRGKSRVVSKQDFYHRSTQSEVQSEWPSNAKNKNIGDALSQDGTVEGDAASIESGLSVKKDNDEDNQEKEKKGQCASMLAIIKCDRETNRLMVLGGPFTVAAVSEAFFDAVTLAVVSNYLGVDALSAFVIVNLMIGLTDTFIKGVADALNTVCSHAIGAENYALAGQYVQIAMVLYILCSVPIVVCWWFLMDDCIRLFGMDAHVVAMGADYAKVLIFDYVAVGLFDTFTALLDVSGYAFPATVFDVLAGTIDMISVWLLLMYVEEMNLFWVGVTQLGTSVVLYLIFGSFAVYRGWLDPFWSGMTKTFALKNIPAVKYVLDTAIPLSFGSLLEYGEWEVLTFVAAALGPAEVATWGIIESVWDLFEAATEGLSEAASIRLAFHLGQGDAEAAKLSSSKSLYLSVCLSCIISAVLAVLMPYIPRWFTKDETLQGMVGVLLPFIAIGNILMVFGMVSWSLIGAQGKYKLATFVSAVMSLCVTLPLAAGFCIGFRFSLEALVGAVVIGYSTSGLVLGYILQMSDWEGISKKIKDLNETEYEDDSSSSKSLDDEFIDNASLASSIMVVKTTDKV